MAALKEYGVTPLKLDTDEASNKAAIAEIIAKEGWIDVLVNNAGHGSYGATEDIDLAEAKRQFDVNLFGLAALTKKCLALHARATLRQNHQCIIDGWLVSRDQICRWSF